MNNRSSSNPSRKIPKQKPRTKLPLKRHARPKSTKPTISFKKLSPFTKSTAHLPSSLYKFPQFTSQTSQFSRHPLHKIAIHQFSSSSIPPESPPPFQPSSPEHHIIPTKSTPTPSLSSLESITSPGQLGLHFRTLASDSLLTFQLNQHYNKLTTEPLSSRFKQLPPTVYCSVIEANITAGNPREITKVLLDSITNNARLPPNVLMLAIKNLSNHGQIDSIESIIKALVQTHSPKLPLKQTSATPYPPNNSHIINLVNHPLIDSQTVTHIKEGLVLAYVSKLRLQDSIQSLSRLFGPGSGSIPSDQLLDIITKHLLRFDRPRHAQQLMQQFDVYCTPKTKSRLYSKIAGNYLDMKMIDNLNTLLVYMERNDITPHPSMIERLLTHIVQNNNPLLSLKWYQQLYNINTPIQNYHKYGSLVQQSDRSITLNDIQTQLDPQLSASTSGGIGSNFIKVNSQHVGFNIKAANTILEGLFKTNHHHQALTFLGKLPLHISTVNVVLKSAYQSRDWDSLRLILKYMLLRGLPLDQQGLHVLIQSLAYHTNPAALTTLLDSLTLKQGIKLHPLTYVRFIRSLKTQGYPKLCELVLNRMKSAAPTVTDATQSAWKPDHTAYTMVIQSYLDHRLLREAFRMKDVMENDGVQPSLMTYSVFLNGLIRSGEALGLYFIITEIFSRADDLMNTQYDLSKLQHTFPNNKQLIQQTQHDQTFTKRQQLLTFLRPYIKAACHLLSSHGHKRHSDNLATFWFTNGGSTTNQKLSQLPTTTTTTTSTATATATATATSTLPAASTNPSQTQQGGDSFAQFSSMSSKKKQQQLEQDHIFGSDKDGVNLVLLQYNAQNEFNSTQPQHDEEALLRNSKITLGELDSVLQNHTKGNKNINTERLRQYHARDDDLYGQVDELFDQIGLQTASKIENTTGGHFSSLSPSLEQSQDLLHQTLNQTLLFDPFAHIAQHVTDGESRQILSSSSPSSLSSPSSPSSTSSSAQFSSNNNSGIQQTMFDVYRLHSLPANSLNDYIDRSEMVSAAQQLQLQQQQQHNNSVTSQQIKPMKPPGHLHYQRNGDSNQSHYQNNNTTNNATNTNSDKKGSNGSGYRNNNNNNNPRAGNPRRSQSRGISSTPHNHTHMIFNYMGDYQM